MHAKPGNWLVAQGRCVDGVVRRGLIEEVHGEDGAPPYLVHWSDTGHRALVFPGPDSYVLKADELLEARPDLRGRSSSQPVAEKAADRTTSGV
ncbi:DUF1918 domain-containing protein [Nocardia miyunensis]|uniref:DUF1918 domain-containing protein n=1 Tax=Nocardia miyunensis TaxID=282684 RepID=UPI00082FE8CA|nr:DUF1918 domain-containing protein [Nocardia miyunensis]